jgi:ATP-binding cassette subfamily F protein 3
VNSFSGGWRMRLQLARALMCPDLLLLDEPTNHLDLDALVWLEAWLKQYSGTMVVISHDREFLDAVTNVTLHIDHGKLVRYGGNYSKFEDMRAEQMILQQAAQAKQQEKMAHLQKFIDRFKAKASKAKQAKPGQGAGAHGEDCAGAGRCRIPVRVQGTGQPAQPHADHVAGIFRLSGRGRCSGRHAAYRDCQRGEPLGAGRPAHRHPGANGQGKSTLVKTVAEALKATSGEIIRGKGLSIGYFSQQELDVLRPEDDPLQHMLRLVRKRQPSCVRPPTTAASRACATSLAPSISAATWSSRRWAA